MKNSVDWTIAGALNWGINLLAVTIVTTIGVGALFEVFQETDGIDKIDDILYVIIAFVFLIWFNSGLHSRLRSLRPAYFLIAGLLLKIIGLVIEKDDINAMGPDIGYVIFQAVALIVFLWNYRKFGKLSSAD